MQPAGDAAQFELGLQIGTAVATSALALLFVGLVPTNEFRARLWFLLATGGPSLSLEAAFWTACWVPSLAILGISRRLSWRAFAGAMVPAIAFVLALAAGALKGLPEFTTSRARILTLVVVAVAVVWTIGRQLSRPRGVGTA